MFIDTHCHLTDARFDADRNDVIARAGQTKVNILLEVGCDPDLWRKALELANENENIFCILGIHPQDAKLLSVELLTEMEALCGKPKVLAVGETGLDYHYMHSTKEQQKESFLRHIELSKKLNKPLSMHCRDSYDDFISVLDEQIKGGNLKGVVHCFSGTTEQAKKIISMGFYLGIDGPVTYPRAEMLNTVVAQTPIDKLLLETDSPYLPPQAHRGERNEPSYVPMIAQKIAEIKNITIEAVAAATTDNARKLFGILP